MFVLCPFLLLLSWNRIKKKQDSHSLPWHRITYIIYWYLWYDLEFYSMLIESTFFFSYKIKTLATVTKGWFLHSDSFSRCIRVVLCKCKNYIFTATKYFATIIESWFLYSANFFQCIHFYKNKILSSDNWWLIFTFWQFYSLVLISVCKLHFQKSKIWRNNNWKLIFTPWQFYSSLMAKVSPINNYLTLYCSFYFYFFNNSLVPFGFLPVPLKVLHCSLGKASCGRVALPHLGCMLGLLVFA